MYVYTYICIQTIYMYIYVYIYTHHIYIWCVHDHGQLASGRLVVSFTPQRSPLTLSSCVFDPDWISNVAYVYIYIYVYIYKKTRIKLDSLSLCCIALVTLIVSLNTGQRVVSCSIYGEVVGK